ncbi:ABC transporter substrate-binding protein [Variovorax sp. VaC1]|uniref:ABC transporter substrate-binding protein n=1 Tax=Variovorax sp. VaC1 TaxID=3373132 RepID=UPI00374A1D25
MHLRLSHRCALAAATFLLSLFAHAENGIGKTSVLLGVSSEFSGQAIARENTDSALAYFAYVNKRGGVFGRQIELKTYDDARDVKKTIENTERLITQDKVFALFGYRSTPTSEVAIPVATRHGVPMVGSYSGAQSVREPFNPLVFHLRASYQQEAAAIIDQLVVQQIHSIAVLYQDDSFGKDGLAGFTNALARNKLKAVATASYSRKDLKVDDASKTLAAASPAAIVMACTPSACVDFIKQTRARARGTQFYLLSNVNSNEFAHDLAADGNGVVVSQIVPSPWNNALPLTREYREALQEAGNSGAIAYGGFEGFITAKLFVMALQRAGADPTRAKFMAALESMREVDLGGMFVRFSPSNHQGSAMVELTMINRNGKYIR